MSQTIRVSAGAAEYTWPATITETTGKDISADVVRVSLGTYAAPAAWVDPSVDTAQANHATRVVQLLVDSNTPAGTYYLWLSVGDGPEQVVRRSGKVVVD